MFPSRLLRGIDLFIEFATLGEYGLEPQDPPLGLDASPTFRVDLAGRGGATDSGAARLVAPSTPAARRLETAPKSGSSLRPELAVPLPSRRTLRSSTFAAAHRVPTARKRTRAGAAPPRPQPCLVAEGERSSAR
jgi:hypothetical protein